MSLLLVESHLGVFLGQATINLSEMLHKVSHSFPPLPTILLASHLPRYPITSPLPYTITSPSSPRIFVTSPLPYTPIALHPHHLTNTTAPHPITSSYQHLLSSSTQGEDLRRCLLPLHATTNSVRGRLLGQLCVSLTAHHTLTCASSDTLLPPSSATRRSTPSPSHFSRRVRERTTRAATTPSPTRRRAIIATPPSLPPPEEVWQSPSRPSALEVEGRREAPSSLAATFPPTMERRRPLRALASPSRGISPRRRDAGEWGEEEVRSWTYLGGLVHGEVDHCDDDIISGVHQSSLSSYSTVLMMIGHHSSTSSS